MKGETPLQRFNSKYAITENGCWEWQHALNGKAGYGMFRYGKSMIPAQRAAWILLKGEIPAGIYVLHTCDNPKCVNPEHLFLGTQLTNMADMKKKGRTGIRGRGVGKTSTQPKLTADIQAYRRNYYLSHKINSKIK